MPSFTLSAVPPFRLDLTVWTLRRRADNLVDRWDGETYRRVLPWHNGAVELAVRQVRHGARPRVELSVSGANLSDELRGELTTAAQRLLGLRIDLAGFYRFAETEPELGQVVARFHGMKPPRFPCVFEALINAIACQQVTLTLGIQLLNKIVMRYGPQVLQGGQTTYGFPTAKQLAQATPDVLREFGLSWQKARSMIELAQAVVGDSLDLEALSDVGDAVAAERLVSLRGVGRWSAEYALLRGLGRTHIFPGDDVGARKRLEQRLGLQKPLDYAGVSHALRAWREFGGLIYFHMLLDGLAEKGVIHDSASVGNGLRAVGRRAN
jgi:DNA-3-methyladenine glycosylase II